MVCWGDENLSRWFYFWHLFNLFSMSTLPPPPPPADLYELSQEPSGMMQDVSLRKMRMRTTRRLKITDSRREVEPLLLLSNCWTWVRGSVAAFRRPQFCTKNNRFGNGSLFALIWMFRACCILIVPFTRDNCPHRCTPFHGFWWTVVSVDNMPRQSWGLFMDAIACAGSKTVSRMFLLDMGGPWRNLR